jgi:hypothetical protein
LTDPSAVIPDLKREISYPRTLIGLDRQWEAGQDCVRDGSVPVDRSLRLHLVLCMMDAIMTIGSKCSPPLQLLCCFQKN